MAADELEALRLRIERLETFNRRLADIVRRSLMQVVRFLEREYNLPPLGESKSPAHLTTQ
jgi:hypothetical protein